MDHFVAFGLLIVAVAALGAGVLLLPKGATEEALVAGTLLRGRPAPNFQLGDQFGHSISLAQLRGHPMVLTFLWTHGAQVDPVVAETLRRAATELGPSARQVGILTVSTDPEGDTPRAMQRFSQERGMLYRWHYLTGSRQQLTRI